jgi:hypothetical protein
MPLFKRRPKKYPKYILPKPRNEGLRRDLILFVLVLIVAVVAVALVIVKG